MPKPRAAIILAAGQGTRMKSTLQKVLHPIGGRAMVDWSLALADAVGATRKVLVIGTHAPALADHARRAVGPDGVAVQDPPLGTGHAVLAAKEALAGFDGDVVVLYADSPLIEAATIGRAFAALDGADVCVLGFRARTPGGYGRLIVGADGSLDRIVEAKEASPDELAVDFCNSGVMAADARVLFALLDKVTNDNAKGEYYLTDVVGLARRDGRRAVAVACDEAEVQGANSRAELAAAEAAFQARTRRYWLDAGVSMTDPETVYFSFDTVLAPDVTLEPGVIFAPGVTVETGARIRAYSHLEGCHVRAGAVVGPFARLRPKADIGEAAHIGNFVEVKAVTVGAGAKANHLAYLGDGVVGAGANIGAGTIFCNYDGFDKHRTIVGANAFVGSNSALVAPVAIGDGAYVGSGSVITEDVAPDALALARARQTEKPGWAALYRARKAAAKAARKSD